MLDQLKEEITRSQFESYAFLRDSVLSDQLALYGAVSEGECLAYVRLSPHSANHNGKSIVEPTVYTAVNYRKQGIAATLLITVFAKHYADCDITYGVDTQNTASNHLAQAIGLGYLGTKYRYTNN
ncbi:MAG: GNAT family N-acetyltransferase [Clostridia bacterium]|nr:GNAT family N-acetyltransferase [Clostridia bacterium]